MQYIIGALVAIVAAFFGNAAAQATMIDLQRSKFCIECAVVLVWPDSCTQDLRLKIRSS